MSNVYRIKERARISLVPIIELNIYLLFGGGMDRSSFFFFFLKNARRDKKNSALIYGMKESKKGTKKKKKKKMTRKSRYFFPFSIRSSGNFSKNREKKKKPRSTVVGPIGEDQSSKPCRLCADKAFSRLIELLVLSITRQTQAVLRPTLLKKAEKKGWKNEM